ncbi:metalloprotease [Maritimibacter sp. DP1N21-5]|uniref:metalloprotease n=1 Tax=Maritimibacter sp. DP1N21-5 TaxID=2836867 RepID=UPI001C46E1A5|nr:site-2 protease family protein [Maritimibacter sp. DP1N21-5]MBV7409162.1 hypothetical protein [Maritimibacter sp. DP1N21-5]
MFSDTNLFSFRAPIIGFNVEVRTSVIFLALIWVGIGAGGGGRMLVYQFATFLILMISIVLHELGHAWACKVQRIPVREVVVFGGGGYCRPGRALTRREDEFVTTVGPVVNLALWAILSLVAPMASGPLAWGLYVGASLNLFLAIFNMLPVLPLDGGRLTLLGLLRFLPGRPAHRVAGFVGLVVCVLWALWVALAIFGGSFFFLLFIPNVARHWQMFREGH